MIEADAAAWRLVGVVLTAIDAADWDDRTRLDVIERAARRIREDVPWTRSAGGQV